ncbi:class I SAM-dependent DNA methyltransferase [Kitasatospora fiedleri]|uniref:class I SAM-dependent DNA methyltransferase n=1 Tax=Kitasatospora fiedleri TaxID=2991545 RepID=UPI00249C8356|nr:class I SAM-dependent methyltransferase [Kitasatospora fiedleri]
MSDADGYFGEQVAERYDESSGPEFRADVIARTVDVLAELAGGGRALELGIGTGRIALPLARRGVPVHGIELSRAMVRRLRAKPGGESIGVTLGDFATAKADLTADGPFALVFLVFNTLMNLTGQEAQVACFRNAADHLAPGGRFVVEVMVPELRKIPAGQNTVPFRTGPGEWAYTAYDTVTQDATCHYLQVTPDGRGTARTVPFRYVWPAELDLMARLAGLRLRDRWDGWTRTPFTEHSTRHVSVWEKPAA